MSPTKAIGNDAGIASNESNRCLFDPRQRQTTIDPVAMTRAANEMTRSERKISCSIGEKAFIAATQKEVAPIGKSNGAKYGANTKKR